MIALTVGRFPLCESASQDDIVGILIQPDTQFPAQEAKMQTMQYTNPELCVRARHVRALRSRQ